MTLTFTHSWANLFYPVNRPEKSTTGNTEGAHLGSDEYVILSGHFTKEQVIDALGYDPGRFTVTHVAETDNNQLPFPLPGL